MKKVLIASTALVMIAGAAAAEVKVSGSARMGVIYNGSDAEFSSRVRIIFTATGETDGGLSFGAETRADQDAGNHKFLTQSAGPDGIFGTPDDVYATVGGGTGNGDSTVYIKGAFGKLTMGDVGGAPDALVGQVSGVGYGPYDDLQEIGFLGTDKTAAYYEYSSGAFTIGVGAGQPTGPNDNLNIAVKYAGPTYSVALGYEDSAGDTQLSASGSTTFGPATIKAKIVDQDSRPDIAFALSVDYATGGATITGFYTDFGNNVQHVGLGAAYDLGGGATLAAGIVQQMATTDTTFADVGVKFKF